MAKAQNVSSSSANVPTITVDPVPPPAVIANSADIMEKLNVMMANMALKSDLESMQQNMFSQTKTMISEEVYPLKIEINTLQQTVAPLSNDVAVLKADYLDLKERTTQLECMPSSSTNNPRGNKCMKVLQSVVYKLAPAKKTTCFHRFT